MVNISNGDNYFLHGTTFSEHNITGAVSAWFMVPLNDESNKFDFNDTSNWRTALREVLNFVQFLFFSERLIILNNSIWKEGGQISLDMISSWSWISIFYIPDNLQVGVKGPSGYELFSYPFLWDNPRTYLSIIRALIWSIREINNKKYFPLFVLIQFISVSEIRLRVYERTKETQSASFDQLQIFN